MPSGDHASRFADCGCGWKVEFKSYWTRAVFVYVGWRLAVYNPTAVQFLAQLEEASEPRQSDMKATHYSRHRAANYIDQSRHPLLYGISQEADWISEDEFPAASEWADVHEEWLRFVDGKGQMPRFVSRLKKSAYQRDRTFAEIAVGYFLETKCSLPIIEWEPPGEGRTRGEFMVGATRERVFVEVKTGGWQKDVKEAEGKNSPRFTQPKYIQAEARSVGNWVVIRNAVSNGYKKFRDSTPSLLMIRDDYFVSLEKLLGPDIALYRSGDGCFTDRRYECLGGVGIFRVDLRDTGLHYHFSVYENPNALDSVKLPKAVFQGYPRCNGTGKLK